VEVHRLDRGATGEGSADGWKWEEVRRHCLRLAYRWAKNPGEAEDIAQDAVLRAWDKKHTLRNPKARNQWLGVIVRNEAFRQHAKPRPSPVSMQEFDPGSDDERVTATVERADLHQAIGRLNERDRLLVRLRYHEDLTQEAIARRLGIPDGTVKVRLHRVRAKLRREIGTV
jgi:RNA polymerase sigma-70 factor, ECF subfamily